MPNQWQVEEGGKGESITPALRTQGEERVRGPQKQHQQRGQWRGWNKIRFTPVGEMDSVDPWCGEFIVESLNCAESHLGPETKLQQTVKEVDHTTSKHQVSLC